MLGEEAEGGLWGMEGGRNKIPLYFHTARYLRPSQIAARAGLYVKRSTLHRLPWFMNWRYTSGDSEAEVACFRLLPNDRRLLGRALAARDAKARVKQRLDALEARRFCFLNHTVNFGTRMRWDPPGVSRLWLYNLHYFDYLWDLICAEALDLGEVAYTCFRDLVDDWIRCNPAARGVGWHAYPVALRIVNWIYAAVAFEQYINAEPSFKRHFLRSIYGQCRFLAHHLEWDSRGNHLLKDGKALLVAGLFFQGAEGERWFRRGSTVVWDALEEQILPDGGHYERSPMYHAIVLQDYLEIAALLRASGSRLPGGATTKLDAMADFFAGLRHPAGEMPLFGDSAFGVTNGPEDLLPFAAVLLNEARYKWAGHCLSPLAAFFLGDEGWRSFDMLPACRDPELGKSAAFPDSGYFVLGDGSGDAMIIDGGVIGPDEVPAHGHCSIFGYELSVGGERVIVDSGVETYEPGAWREYYRSTRAHSTLVVNGEEQSQTWAAFRVGRRARVQGVRWQARGRVAWFAGTHDGFSGGRGSIKHRRLVVCLPGVGWLVADRVSGEKREVRLESFIHLHPEIAVAIDRFAEGKLQLLNGVSRECLAVTPFGFGDIHLVRGDRELLQGWYAAEFGCRVPNSVVSLTAEAILPHLCGYLLCLPGAGAATVEVACDGEAEVYRIMTSVSSCVVRYGGGNLVVVDGEAG